MGRKGVEALQVGWLRNPEVEQRPLPRALQQDCELGRKRENYGVGCDAVCEHWVEKVGAHAVD